MGSSDMLLVTMLLLLVMKLGLVHGATDEIEASVTRGTTTLSCSFKFVYKLGKTRLDLRRSNGFCTGGTSKSLLFIDEEFSSMCGSNFTVSFRVREMETKLLEGNVEAASNCKPPPATAEPTPKKRRCPHGYSYVCPSRSDGTCLPRMISLCFNYGGGGGGSGNGSSRLFFQESERGLTPAEKEEVALIREACTCIPNLAVYSMVIGVRKGEDRSLSDDYEDLNEDDEEEFEEYEEVEKVVDHNGLTEYDRDFWDTIMGKDKRTQCSETTGWETKKISGTNVKCKFTFKYTEAGVSSRSATCKGVNSGTKKANAWWVTTSCGSVIVVKIWVTKNKATIKTTTLKSVGDDCSCSSANAATTTTTTVTTGATTTTTITTSTTTTTTTTTTTPTTTTTTTT